MAALNPNASQTAQNYKIDIGKVYSDFINEIDANRSLVNISKSLALDKFNEKTVNNLNRYLKIEDTPQESRVHCFYRLIGFPVVASDKRFYNPGFDNVPGDKNITISDKIEIANSPLPGFKDFSVNRENFINDIKRVWAARPATISASALALSSSIYTRPFNAPVQNTEPFSFAVKDQGYVADFRSIIGKNNTVLLTDYVDALGNKPDPTLLIPQRAHLIKPFIVDARIDFSCNPASRKVAVPFVLNKTNLLIGESTFVKRPLLEKVIRDRFAVKNDKENSTAQQKIEDFIKNVPSVQDADIINQMTSDRYKLDQKAQFQKYLYLIGAMCKELVKSQLQIKTVQSRYYWLPLPSINGPEGGCDISSVIISESLPDGDNNSFITEADRSLIKLSLQQAANDFNAQTAPVKGIPDVGDFAFGAIQTFEPDTSQAFGDHTSAELKKLLKNRSHDLKIANNALRTIEIIMGEFSGLGLCDILAVMGALYVMPEDKLLGFLDDDAFERMSTALSLEQAPVTRSSIEEAQQSLVGLVKDFYNLMDDIYKDLDKNNGLSS